MLNSLRPVGVILRREVRDQFRDWRIIAPIVVLTLFFPLLMNFTAGQIVDFVKKYGGEGLIIDRMIPFLLMVVGFFPITVSLVIALESFSGETERHSIEPLLSTPLADWQLYLGKLLASLAVPLFASYLGTSVYLTGVLITVEDFRPPPVLVVQILLLAAAQALVMVSGAVVISTQTTSVRAANLLASFIIIPMALLMQAESVVMLWAQYDLLWLAILGQGVLAGMLLRTGVAHFNREELLGREIDTLNFRWGWQVFKQAFVGQAKNIGEWYRLEVAATLRRLSVPILLMPLLLGVGVAAGVWAAGNIPSSPGVMAWLGDVNRGETVQAVQSASAGTMLATFLFIWLNNLKSVALVSLAGIFSFGVLGILGLFVTMAVLGVLAALAPRAGLPVWTFLAVYILPHGALEIPAILLSGAAILRMGTTMVTPAQGQTIGQAWLRSLADWCKVIIGLVIPLFFFAAIIETFITPQIIVAVLGGP